METRMTVSKSIFGRRNERDNRKKKQIMEMMLERESNMNHLFDFKTQPSMEPNSTEARPISLCCDSCLPNAQVAILDDFKHLGLVDCFNPPTSSSYNPYLTKMFPFYYHYQNIHTFKTQLPTWNELEKDPKLLSLYQGTVSEETKQNVLATIEKLRPKRIWTWLLSACLWQKYLSFWCFESILVHQGEINLRKEVHTKKLPVIYIPASRSRWDTTLILYVLAHNGLPTPFFLSAHNSRKRLAAYYGGIGGSLRTKFDGASTDRLYSSAVSCYLRNLIQKRNSLMFNLELGRSRTGAPSSHVYGSELLRIIYDEYCSNKIEDAYFVPVSVSYESPPDATELFSKRSPTKNPVKLLFACLSNLFKWTKYRKGTVKVDFAQPICLRELEQSLKKNSNVLRAVTGGDDIGYHRSRDCTFLRWDSSDSLDSVSSLYGALAPLYPEDTEVATVLDIMNYHLVYDAGKCGSVMPTHLVAFLLMKKFSGVVVLDELVRGLQWLVKVVKSNKRDFGFALNETDMESIAFRGVQYLGEDVSCRWIDDKNTYEIKARNDTESLRRVEYFSNYLMPDFIMEAIIATAIFSQIGSELTILRGFDNAIRIKDADFIYHCRRVYEVFTSTFILHPPCLTPEASIRKKTSEMGNAGRLFLETRDSRNYHWEDNSDDDYYYEPAAGENPSAVDTGFTFVPDEVRVTTSQSTFEYMDFHRKLLVPYLEIYAFLTTSLKSVLLKPSLEEVEEVGMKTLENHLLVCLQQEADRQFQNCRQLLNMDTVKAFLVTCEDHGILYCQHGKDPNDGTMGYYQLENKYIDKDGSRLNKQADDFLLYVTK